jgi:hypothetical protein
MSGDVNIRAREVGAEACIHAIVWVVFKGRSSRREMYNRRF